MGKFFLWLALLWTSLSATEYKPWYDRNLEITMRLTEIYQHYTKLNIHHKNYDFRGRNLFEDISLALPYDEWEGQLELLIADTRQRSTCVDSLKFTGRYMPLENVTVGLSIIQAFGKAVQDFATFHPGKLGFEGHVAVGREWDWSELWESRLWGMFGLGKADTGPPWILSELAWEQRSRLGNFVRVFSRYRHGFGEHHRHIRNLSQLNYRFLDLGLRLTHRFDNYAELYFEYAYRTCVKNGLANMNIFQLQFLYPFGL